MAERGWIDSVIRIGSVPTLRFWRDLEKKWSEFPVWNFSSRKFSGLARFQQEPFPLAALNSVADLELDCHEQDFWKELDGELSKNIQVLMSEFLRSEPSQFRSLSAHVAAGSPLFIGNSLPIREWDLAADRRVVRKVFANRGANGIDGQLSTFLGLLSEGQTGWGVFGDLTTLYDLSSPWALKGSSVNAQIVVINNSGGQIFSRLFDSSRFRNEHDLDFSKWAEMWGLGYHRWTEIPDVFSADGSNVIEIVPDARQTADFWMAYDKIFC